jgi:glycine/D-amino acid oxidase-like deaminating enzyme
MAHDSRSYWIDTTPPSSYRSLQQDVKVDVAVIGAGIVGITTAFLLKRAGLSVALVEARRAAEQVSGLTTAKVTSLHGLRGDGRRIWPVQRGCAREDRRPRIRTGHRLRFRA